MHMRAGAFGISLGKLEGKVLASECPPLVRHTCIPSISGLPQQRPGSVMAPRKKDKAKSEARKHKRAGKDVLREIHRMCPEARIAGQGLTLDGTEIRIASPKLISLPESIGTLDALRRLDLSACISLASLPDAIGKLCALTGPVSYTHLTLPTKA